MNKYWLSLGVALSVAFNAAAQNGTKFFSVKGGVTTKESISVTISYDWNTRYFNQNEIYTEYSQKWDNSSFRTIMAGFALKPILFRSANTAVRVRYGAGVGSNTNKVIFAPLAGLELSQSLAGLDLVLSNRNQFIFGLPKDERWRAAIEIGISLPLN